MADPNVTKYAVKVLPVSFYSLFSIYHVGIKIGFSLTYLNLKLTLFLWVVNIPGKVMSDHLLLIVYCIWHFLF